jgi:Dyp-type peroxidase family protein
VRDSVSPEGTTADGVGSDQSARRRRCRSRLVAQPVVAPLSAAIFLIATTNPGPDNLATIRWFCGDLAALLRAVEFRDIEAGLSWVVGFGSEVWDRLFGGPRSADLHTFREIRAGGRHAVSTPGHLLFHIRVKRIDLCFEPAMQIMARIGDAVSQLDEVHGFRYFDDHDLIGFGDGTENPRGDAAMDPVLIGEEDEAFAGGSYVIVQKYLHDLDGWNALPTEAQEGIIESSVARCCATSNWTIPSSQPRRTTRSPRSLRTEKRSRSCATTCLCFAKTPYNGETLGFGEHNLATVAYLCSQPRRGFRFTTLPAVLLYSAASLRMASVTIVHRRSATGSFSMWMV